MSEGSDPATFDPFGVSGKLPSRRYLHATARERSQYARQLGEVAFAWNSAHAKLFRLFGVIVTDFDWEAAQALWHSHGSDRLQRVMFEAVISKGISNCRMRVTK